jgi:hypothetical protein
LGKFSVFSKQNGKSKLRIKNRGSRGYGNCPKELNILDGQNPEIIPQYNYLTLKA